MSLRLRDRLRITVGTDRLGASVWRRGWVGLGAVRLCAQAEVSLPGLDGLGAALEVLLATLASQVDLRDMPADVELADTLVTLDVIEGDFADHTERQLHAIAAACITELLGEASAAHEVRWQLQRDERHLLLCALQRDTLTALATTLPRDGVGLRCVQPRFCSVWNRQAKQLGSGPVVFAVADDSHVSIACVRGGVITALGRAAGTDSAGALDTEVNRLRAGLGLDDEATRYLLVADDTQALPRAARWMLFPTGALATANGSRA